MVFEHPPQSKWHLHYTRPDTTQVTSVVDRAGQKQEQIRMEKEAFKAFDSTKNWSIMIHPELNELRNDIMKRTKSNQIKRRIQSRPQIVQKPVYERTSREESERRKTAEEGVWRENYTDYLRSVVTKSSNMPAQPQ